MHVLLTVSWKPVPFTWHVPSSSFLPLRSPKKDKHSSKVQVCWRCVVSWRKVMWWLHLWQLNPCNNWLLNPGSNGFFALLVAWASCGNLPGDFCKVVTSKAVAVIWMWREIRWPNKGLGNEIYTSSSQFFWWKNRLRKAPTNENSMDFYIFPVKPRKRFSLNPCSKTSPLLIYALRKCVTSKRPFKTESREV